MPYVHQLKEMLRVESHCASIVGAAAFLFLLFAPPRPPWAKRQQRICHCAVPVGVAAENENGTESGNGTRYDCENGT